MGAGDHEIEFLKKISELEAYVRTLMEDAKCLETYKSDVVTLKAENAQLKKEVSKLWDILDDLRDARLSMGSRMDVNDEKVKTLFQRSGDVKKMLKSYPEIRDTYKQVKRLVVAAVVGAILLAAGIAWAVSFFL